MDVYEKFIEDYKKEGDRLSRDKNMFPMTDLVDWIMEYIEEDAFKHEIADCFVKARFNPHGTHALALCKGDTSSLAKKLNVKEDDLFK